MTAATWFSVDRDGLRKLIEHRPKLFLIAELLSNAWDEASQHVSVTLDMTDVRGRARLVVTDDSPSGFADVTHAYTLFAESTKKSSPEQRGRFNLGEKLVLSLCYDAEIVTTTAHVRFHDDGTRTMGRQRTAAGSVFSATVRMTKAELAEVEETVLTLIPPPQIVTTFNARPLEVRVPIATFEATLPTVRSDAEGVLRDAERKTTVDVYVPRTGEDAAIYELGIPVVCTGDRYHLDVRQKVPLNSERDNVRPSFLRKLRTATLNATFSRLDQESAKSAWVSEALGDKNASPDAVRVVLTQRYGDKVVTADPFDAEANARATANGYAVLRGGAFNGDQWSNIRNANAAPVSTDLFKTPSPLSGDPSAPIVDTLSPSDYTEGMRHIIRIAEEMARYFFGIRLATAIVRSHEPFRACYGDNRLIFNLRQLRKEWFDPQCGFTGAHLARVLSLLVHELAHHRERNHLSDAYFHALSDLGGELAVLALSSPEIFAHITTPPTFENA